MLPVVAHLVLYSLFGDFPKLGVPLSGFPIVRIIVYWGPYWGRPIWEIFVRTYTLHPNHLGACQNDWLVTRLGAHSVYIHALLHR